MPSATEVIADLCSLEAQSASLFSVEAGYLPGLVIENHRQAHPLDGSKLMAAMRFNLSDGESFSAHAPAGRGCVSAVEVGAIHLATLRLRQGGPSAQLPLLHLCPDGGSGVYINACVEGECLA